jgi:hypothetical protein
VNAPVPPPPGRDRTAEIAIVAGAAVFIAMLLLFPEGAFWVLIIFLMLVSLR